MDQTFMMPGNNEQLFRHQSWRQDFNTANGSCQQIDLISSTAVNHDVIADARRIKG